jgi:transcriptional regulator with XRE-family HTH domain
MNTTLDVEATCLSRNRVQTLLTEPKADGITTCMKRFIDHVEAIREMRGLSAAELSRRCGWSPSRYSKWVSGIGQVDVDQAKALAKALDVPIDYLLYYENGMASPPPPARTPEVDHLLRLAEILGGHQRAVEILMEHVMDRVAPPKPAAPTPAPILPPRPAMPLEVRKKRGRPRKSGTPSEE